MDRPLKRRACEVCRKLKVQCTFNSNEASCSRCLKSNKACIVTGRRRRHVVGNSAVTELERKINALSASLDAIKATPSSSGSRVGKSRENLQSQERSSSRGFEETNSEGVDLNHEQPTVNAKAAYLDLTQDVVSLSLTNCTSKEF